AFASPTTIKPLDQRRGASEKPTCAGGISPIRSVTPAVFGRRYWSCSRNGNGCRAVRRDGWDPLPPAVGRLDPLPPAVGRLDPLPPAVGRRYLPPSLRSGGLILALASLRGTYPRSRCAPGDLSRGLPGFPWTPVGGSATLASLTIGGSVRRWESPDRSRPGPRKRATRPTATSPYPGPQRAESAACGRWKIGRAHV